MMCLYTDGYCIVLVMEATLFMKLLEKITVAFEQVYCENRIAVGREDGMWLSLISQRLFCPSGVRAGGPAFPGDSRGAVTSVKLALDWTCCKCV